MKTATGLFLLFNLCFINGIILNEPTPLNDTHITIIEPSTKPTIEISFESPKLINNETYIAELTHNGSLCDLCNFVVETLNATVLQNPKVIEIATESLDQVCKVLPSSFQPICMEAAQKEAPTLLEMLGDYLVNNACNELKLCSNIHLLHHMIPGIY